MEEAGTALPRSIHFLIQNRRMSAVAFVAGATGYTGNEVVRALRARQIATHAHVRADSPRLAEWKQRFEAQGAITDTTAWEPEAMRAAMARIAPTHIFALLGTTRARAKKENASYETVDYGMTAMLLRAAREAGLSPRFVYLSSAGVSKGSASKYIEVRWRFEQELAASGVPYAIARPSIITGPDRAEDRPMEKVAQSVGDGLLGFVGALGGAKLRDRWKSTNAETLAKALVRLAFDEQANRIYESEELR